MRFKTSAIRALTSLVLSYLSLRAIGLLDRFPNQPVLGDIADKFAFPGALIASLLYPQGIHSGSGSMVPVYITVVGNLLIYAFLWFLILGIAHHTMGRVSRKTEETDHRGPSAN